MIGYKRGADLAADLKRTAHAVRQAVDARPVTSTSDGRKLNPRRERLVERISAKFSSGATPGMLAPLEAPHLSKATIRAIAGCP